MKREYHKWFSANLNREMELLVFGTSGASVIFFPTRTARFYDYEDWKIIEAIKPKIEAGLLQVYCVDSIDLESFYCEACPPPGRIYRHLQYENYILKEIIPLVNRLNPGSALIATGCSFGAYHAFNIAFRHSTLFDKVLGMSGRYDLTKAIGPFRDLFEGYWDETIYFNMPSQYLPNLTDENILQKLKQMEIIIAVGEQDPFLENNKELSLQLWNKNILNALHIWDEEAHRARYWREMVKIYL